MGRHASVLSPRACKALVSDKNNKGMDEAARIRHWSRDKVFREIRKCDPGALIHYVRKGSNAMARDLKKSEVQAKYSELGTYKATAVFFGSSPELVKKVLGHTARRKASRKTPTAVRQSPQLKCPEVKVKVVQVRMKTGKLVPRREGGVCPECRVDKASSWRTNPIESRRHLGSICNIDRHNNSKLLKKGETDKCVERCRRSRKTKGEMGRMES